MTTDDREFRTFALDFFRLSGPFTSSIGHWVAKVESAQAALARLQAVTPDAAASAAATEWAELSASWHRLHAVKCGDIRGAEALVSSARRWVPPTPDHEAAKRSLEEKAENLLRQHQRPLPPLPACPTGPEWLRKKIEAAEEEVAACVARRNEVTLSVGQEGTWLAALKASLPAENS